MPTLPFNLLQRLDLPLTEYVSGRIGYVHDAFLPFPYEIRESLPDDGRDLVVLIGKKNRAEGIRAVGERSGRAVIAFAAGDAGIRAAYLKGQDSLPPNVVAAFAVNNELADRRAVSVPLGVRASNLRALKFVRQNHRGGKCGLLYGNFTLNDQYYHPDRAGTPHIRERLVARLRDTSWTALDISDDHRKEPANLVDYYARTAGHRFVLSPEGNGVDCYRTWEALYLGAIPIVMVSTVTSEFAGLPILFTNDYSELSEEYLEERWQEMSSRSFPIERMMKAWYTNRFLDAVSTLDDPRFVCWQVDESPSWKFVKTLERSSRSPSGVVAETPKPPFTGPRDAMRPDDWTVSGSLRLAQLDGGLGVAVQGEGPGAADLPFETIAGGPFRIVARVGSEAGHGDTLELIVRAGREIIARAEVHDAETTVDLPFRARSDRTVLSIRAEAAAPEASWLLGGLAIEAKL